eukprot:3486598-Rhodomonas_salina.2
MFVLEVCGRVLAPNMSLRKSSQWPKSYRITHMTVRITRAPVPRSLTTAVAPVPVQAATIGWYGIFPGKFLLYYGV